MRVHLCAPTQSTSSLCFAEVWLWYGGVPGPGGILVTSLGRTPELTGQPFNQDAQLGGSCPAAVQLIRLLCIHGRGDLTEVSGNTARQLTVNR